MRETELEGVHCGRCRNSWILVEAGDLFRPQLLTGVGQKSDMNHLQQ